MQSFRGYRAVLFDLDGTLLDTLTDIADAANAVLVRQGFAGHCVAAYRTFVGDGVAMLFRRALPLPDPPADLLAACVDGFHESYARCWDRQTRPYEGIAELLDGLTARGLSLAVLSNKPHEFTRMCIARYFPRWKFDAVLGQRAGTPHKPAPDGALEIARRLAVPPAEFAYLGDSSVDMHTARAAGMFAVGAAWGFRTAAELQASGARAVITRPQELLALLAGLQSSDRLGQLVE